jgi:hypothetical protein
MSSNKYTFIIYVGTQVSMDDAQMGFILGYNLPVG